MIEKVIKKMVEWVIEKMIKKIVERVVGKMIERVVEITGTTMNIREDEKK
jgi:hypothetical protein